jgi:hypothetical protein
MGILVIKFLKWVWHFISDNDWADKEAEHYFPKDKDESN